MTKSTYTELWGEDKYSTIDTHQGLCLEMFCSICSNKQKQHIFTLHIQYVFVYHIYLYFHMH